MNSMALKKVRGTFERALDKNLQDLVRGIRNHKDNEAKYIADCIDEIKQELRQANQAIKANAVSKLTYLQMLGYDISWAAFNVIEVMSAVKFTFKRMGYLAAAQSFNDSTDVLMLTTNLIRKDLNSNCMYDAGVALNGLSCFITADLARDLANDIMTLMTSTKPYLRKKSVLIMYKVFLKFPEALRPAFPRLKEKLEDPDPGVQSAAVNVICELARKNPKNYLSLAPLFFKLMTSSTNNWVLIKIIKLFGALTPLEPRLGKKLIEPLTNLIHSTSAMSLLYECINTVIAVLISISSGIPNHSASIQLCVQKLRILIEDSDQNLKYLGLLAMARILKTHPKSVQAHKDLILQCLDDKDESIRLRALDLLYGMVSKKNLMDIVKKLMIHVDKAEGSHYRDELLSKIIEICSQSNYQYITNFDWYITILVELTRIEGTKHGKLIASQMLDVAIRVQAIRPCAVREMACLIENTHLITNNSQANGICEVLYAAAWICGEFSEHLSDPSATLKAMLHPKVTYLPGHIQSILVQNVIKLYASILVKAELDGDLDVIHTTGQMLIEKLPMFVQSADLEVQERACCILQLMKYIQKLHDKGMKVSEEVSCLFAGELNPVASKAQKKVPVPEGLDLDKWINEPPSDSSDDDYQPKNIFTTTEERSGYQQTEKPFYQPTEEELEKRREERKNEQAMNPHYLKGEIKSKALESYVGDVSSIPIKSLDISTALSISDFTKERKRKEKKKKKYKGKKGYVDTDSDQDFVAPNVSSTFDIPEGVTLSDDDGDNRRKDDPYKMLDIDLDQPLRDDERIPQPMHRVVEEKAKASEPPRLSKKKKIEKSDNVKKEKKEKSKKIKKEKHSRQEKSKEPSSELPLENGNICSEEEMTSNKNDDMEFWLSGTLETNLIAPDSPVKASISPEPENDVSAALTSAYNDIDAIEEDGDKKQKKKKKEKKERKVKKEKRKKQSEYEIAEGITTPSQECVTITSSLSTPAAYKLPPMSSYAPLADDSNLKMVYECKGSLSHRNQIIACVIFNNLSVNHIKDMEFNVLDSLNVKLVRIPESQDAVKVPFTLPPSAQNEAQFAFTVENINTPQRLKGTLTYILKTEDGSLHDKIDFKLNVMCSSYLVALPCNGDAFATLLAAGTLNEKHSISFKPVDTDFNCVLAKICFFLHFIVVEQIDSSASLYSKSIQNHDICLLVKMSVDDSLSLDGKAADLTLLTNVLGEIKQVLTS